MSLKEYYRLIFIFFAACILTSCKPKNNPPFDNSHLQSNVSAQATVSAGIFIKQYLDLKNALVATNNTDAHKVALLMQSSVLRFRNDLLNDSLSFSKQLLIQTDSIQQQLKIISENDQPNCEPQRIAFKYLSDNVLLLLKTIKITHLKLYVQYTPLALNERGGTWLSTSEAIENPYFGSKMLTSGDVIDTLK